MVRRLDDQRLKITRFMTGQPDQIETCSHELGSLIRGIVNVGGGYSELLQGLQEAKKKGYLGARMLVGVRPRKGRTYYRVADRRQAQSLESPADVEPTHPVPELFTNRLLTNSATEDDSAEPEKIESPVSSEKSKESFFGKMRNWFSG